MQQALYTLLSTDATILSLLGGAKVYYPAAPEGTTPSYIVFSNINPEIGALYFDTEESRSYTFQIDVYSIDTSMPPAALAISERIITILNYASTIGTHALIHKARVSGPEEIREPNFDNLWRYVITLDVDFEPST